LDSLKKSYADLGLNVNDVGLNALFMQATILKGNPALVAGIDALASQFKAMDDLGLLNVQTFGQMQATGEAMYTRLQSAAEAAGGSTKDALLPMQQWLHQAATEATKLGVPLDDATQLLIDQSKELGIWKEQGIDPMIDGMNKLIDAVKELVNQLTNSLSPAITNLPSVPGPSAASSGGATQNFAGGGRVIQFPGTSGGTDSQIIRATPGEAVLTPDQQQALLGGGGGPIEITLINRMDGVEMSRTVTRIQSRDLAIRRKLGAA
jgi:tetrahydromethanopterin S-methyltransferase subunit B